MRSTSEGGVLSSKQDIYSRISTPKAREHGRWGRKILIARGSSGYNREVVPINSQQYDYPTSPHHANMMGKISKGFTSSRRYRRSTVAKGGRVSLL